MKMLTPSVSSAGLDRMSSVMRYRVQKPNQGFGEGGESFTSKLTWLFLGAVVAYVVPPLIGGVVEGAKEAITEDSARDTRREFRLKRRRR